jgi:hypothetical protein
VIEKDCAVNHHPAQVTIGPVIEDRFYYDFAFGIIGGGIIGVMGLLWDHWGQTPLIARFEEICILPKRGDHTPEDPT